MQGSGVNLPRDLLMVENLWRTIHHSSYPKEATHFLVQGNLKICHRFLKVPIATSNFTSKVYNGGFVQEVSVSMLKEIIALV